MSSDGNYSTGHRGYWSNTLNCPAMKKRRFNGDFEAAIQSEFDWLKEHVAGQRRDSCD